MLMRSVPPHAKRCGDGNFIVKANSADEAIEMVKRFETGEMREKVHAVVLRALEKDPDLRDQVSQQGWSGEGYTVGGEPSEHKAGRWNVPFAAYVFEKP